MVISLQSQYLKCQNVANVCEFLVPSLATNCISRENPVHLVNLFTVICSVAIYMIKSHFNLPTTTNCNSDNIAV